MGEGMRAGACQQGHEYLGRGLVMVVRSGAGAGPGAVARAKHTWTAARQSMKVRDTEGAGEGQGKGQGKGQEQGIECNSHQFIVVAHLALDSVMLT